MNRQLYRIFTMQLRGGVGVGAGVGVGVSGSPALFGFSAFHLWPKNACCPHPLDSSLNTCLVVHKFHLEMIIFIEIFFFAVKWHIIVPAWLCGPSIGAWASAWRCVCVCVLEGAALHPPAIWPVSHL